MISPLTTGGNIEGSASRFVLMIVFRVIACSRAQAMFWKQGHSAIQKLARSCMSRVSLCVRVASWRWWAVRMASILDSLQRIPATLVVGS
jgi:mannose/fructose/N-acetylgalactosamine-specific phosphotransferase system component IID